MVPSFWQLVVEKKVAVIVMVTGLVENGVEKATQYWPDKDEPEKQLKGGITVRYVRHSFHGKIRIFKSLRFLF